MNITLKPVTRNNWEEALKLSIKEEQREFVPLAAISLAKIYIKPDGDNIVYVPFSIYNDEIMVGFIMHAYDENTTNMYWINGFIIDKQEQGKGYGKAALKEIIAWIKNKFSQCKEIRLTVHKDNVLARKLYVNMGFDSTGDYFGDEEVMGLLV